VAIASLPRIPAYNTFMQAGIRGKEAIATKGNAYSWRRSA
jgi:hypothetical protein